MAQIAVVLSEKVDTTVSKGVLRIIGSAIGGAFGAILPPPLQLQINVHFIR